MPDGSHFIPDEKKRLWAESPEYERKKCWISTAVVALFGSSIFVALGSSVSAFLYYYLAPVLVFGWWLMAVTYLQHHADDTLVYSDKDWKYVDAAFETVDRKYGLGIDALHHHISDGHVVHHLFFTQIPHYHLAEATEGLKKYLKEHNLYHLYKLVDTKDFPVRLHKDFYNKRFDGVLAKGPLDKTPRIA
jgi:omega-3 fatty acid desaturase (delta-15 desaturase)